MGTPGKVPPFLRDDDPLIMYGPRSRPENRRRSAESGRLDPRDISEKPLMNSRRSRSKSPKRARKAETGREEAGTLGRRGGGFRADHRAGRPSARGRRWGSAALPLLPLRSDVVFPQTVVPLVINRPSGIRLIDDA